MRIFNRIFNPLKKVQMRRVLHAKLDSKKKLIMRREEIIDDRNETFEQKSLNLSRAINTKNGFKQD